MNAIRFAGSWTHRETVVLARMPDENLGCYPWRIAYERWSDDWFLDRIEPQQTIIVFVGGSGSCEFGGRRYPLREGSVFAYGGGTRYSVWCDREHPLELYVVHLGGGDAGAPTTAASGSQMAVLTLRSRAPVVAVLEGLMDAARRHTPFTNEVCAAHVPLLLWTIRSNAEFVGSKRTSGSRYREVRRYIADNYQSIRRIRDVARACGMRVEYVCRLFRENSETTAYGYLMTMKANHIVHAMQSSRATLHSLANELGFADEHSLSRAFSQAVGVSPRAYLAEIDRGAVRSAPEVQEDYDA